MVRNPLWNIPEETVTRIDSSDVAKISWLVSTFDNHRAVVEAVASGYEEGWIIVDDGRAPTCFLIHNSGGFFFLHGMPNAVFIEQVSEYLYQDLKLECIEVVISDPALEKVIPAVFRNRKHKVFRRAVFRLNLERFSAVCGSESLVLPTDIRVERVSEVEFPRNRRHLIVSAGDERKVLEWGVQELGTRRSSRPKRSTR
jgi:hypothetical protein